MDGTERPAFRPLIQITLLAKSGFDNARAKLLPHLPTAMTLVLLSLISVLALVVIEGQDQLVGTIRAK